MAGKALKVAQLHALESGAGVDYQESTAEDWAHEHPAAFDVVTCMEMLEHVPDPARSVAACAALARPGGWVFFSTINRNPKAFLLAIVGAEYVLNLLPRGTHEFAKFIRPSELSGFARDAGLDLHEIVGMSYNPFTKSAALGRDTDVNYLMAFRKPAELIDGGVRLVLFDLDGTLADTAPDLAGAVNRMLSTRGREPLPLDALRPLASHGARGLIGRAFGLTPADAGYEALRQEFFAEYESALCEASVLFPTMAETLAALEADDIRWGIVTNKIARFTEPLVRALGLAQRAACVVSGDTTAHAKPHPAPLLHALRQTRRTAPEALYVGDDLRDVQAGQAAGMRTVVAAYGYLGNETPIERWGADDVITRPTGLLELLKV